jgi:YbbR domain-containing protein
MIKRFFLDDLLTKLMAVALAVVVWIFLNQGVATESEITTVTTEARLTVLPPRGVAILRVAAADGKGERLDGTAGSLIQVVLRGTKSVLYTARRGIECRHLLDIPDPLAAGEPTTVQSVLRPTDFDLPRGLEVVKIDPSRIQVQVGQEFVRPLRIDDTVKACLRNVPAAVQVDRIAFNPTYVHVRGLRHILDRLNTIPIVLVDMGDRTGAFSQHVEIVEEIQGTPVSTNEPIEMTVTLRPADEERAIGDLRVELLFPEGFARPRDKVRVAEPAAVKVVVRGPLKAVEAVVLGRRVRIFADAAGLGTASRGEVPLRPLLEDSDLAGQVRLRLDPPRAVLEVVE